MKQSILLSALLVLTVFCFARADKYSADKKPAAASHDVSIKNMSYIPAQLTIAPGDSVVWTNNDDRDHTVVSSDKSFKSANLAKGDSFSHTFSKRGKFSYGCSYHPRMKGVIIVSANGQ